MRAIFILGLASAIACNVPVPPSLARATGQKPDTRQQDIAEAATERALKDHNQAVHDAYAVYIASSGKYGSESPEALSALASYHAQLRDDSWAKVGASPK